MLKSLQRMQVSHGINIKLLNASTLRPFNEDIIEEIAQYKKVFVVEEHSMIGGLNSIISEKI